MNVGKMLVDLGFKSRPEQEGFPCPAIKFNSGGWIRPSGMEETKEEIAAAVDMEKTLGERVYPKKASWGRQV